MDMESLPFAQSSPGGQKVTARKKRSLKALEQAAKKKHRPEPEQAQPSPITLPRPSGQPAMPQQATQRPSQPLQGPMSLYQPLSNKLLTGAVGKALQLSDSVGGGPKVPHILLDAMMTNPDVKTVAHARSQTDLTHKRVPLENFSAKSRMQPTAKRYSQKLAGAKARKALQLTIQRSDCTFETLQPLHAQWKDYASKLIIDGLHMEALVWEHLELHCSWLKVIRSSNPRLVGVGGIVVKDSSSSYHIVDPKDRYHIAPKDSCSFELGLGTQTLILNTGRLRP